MGKTIVFESDRDHELFMQDFLSPSYIEDKFNSWKVLENYDVKNIDFKQSLINELISKGIAKKEELEK